MMMKDHRKSGERLKELAASKNITLPDSISNRQQKEKDRLQKMKGDAFDEAYINRMTDDHKKDVREFEKQATDGTNQDIKSFASDNLKMLHVHLDLAVNILRKRRLPRVLHLPIKKGDITPIASTRFCIQNWLDRLGWLPG
jgi:putative membrane protein